MISDTTPLAAAPWIVDRDSILILLQAGMDTRAYRFTRQTALAWLTAFPGDMEVNLFYAKALVKEERFAHASPVIQRILHADPEFIEAAVMAELIFSKSDVEFLPMATGTIRALGGKPLPSHNAPVWGEKIDAIREALASSLYDKARELLFVILEETQSIELVSIYHLLITEKLESKTSLINLARLYHSRYPDCVQIALLLANALMESNEEDEAVKLLHFCAAHDPAAQIPSRLWGNNFVYRMLYPQKMTVELDFPMPAEVAGKLGLNQMGSGGETTGSTQTSAPASTSAAAFDGFRVIPTRETEYPQNPREPQQVKKKSTLVKEVEGKLNKIAHDMQQPVLTHTDERFPAHVILSMKSGLKNEYGEQSAQVILEEMAKLGKMVQDKLGWTSILFLPDDLAICGKYQVTPVDKIDPWKIKLALVDLDKALEKEGVRIGSVLIVGGDGVVPFHRLPNPTDDADQDVPSDSPYGSLDTNYFVSDWAVGRLPGESGGDSGLLITQIRNSIDYHNDSPNSASWLDALLRIIAVWDQPWARNFSNIGYSAAVWRRSSIVAFRPVGEGKNLYLSPNANSVAFDPKRLAQAPIGYFNVHGVEDGSEWYGQKDAVEGDSGPDFPVALKPTNIQSLSNVPDIVFCEACYGGHILGKKESDSIALTMLGKGVNAMIASSTISYGSVATPLIGADLYGYLVMKNLRDGLTIGASIVKAKAEFVREMNRRQGYLDGEDQKTLISFNLYGDPLTAYDPFKAMKKVNPRELNRPVIKTISDNSPLDQQTQQLTPQLISQAKLLVKNYLPGIEYAEVRVKSQQVRTNNTSRLGKVINTSITPVQPNRVIVTFSKQVTQAHQIHRQYARVTLDKEGKVVKLAVSR